MTLMLMDPHNIDLSVIILNYRSEDLLETCLASIFKHFPSPISFEVLIANNDTPGKITGVLRTYPAVLLVENGENIGFGAANNRAASLARGKYLFFLNPDTKIVSPEIMAALQIFKKSGAVGIIGGSLLTEEGKPQAWSAGSEMGLLGLMLNKLGFPKGGRVWKKNVLKKVDWVAGTAMLVEKELFNELGGFDSSFFMYFEDMDLCKRARAKNRRVVYFPQLQVLHIGGASYQGSGRQKKNYYASQEIYFRKHRPRWEGLLLSSLKKIFVRI